MSDRPALQSWPARAAGVTALAVGAGILTLVPGGSPSAAAAGLVPWPGCDAMVGHYRAELVRSATPYGAGSHGAAPRPEGTRTSVAGSSGDAVAVAAAPSAAESSALGGAVGSGPTGTNVQEAGVDEPDTAKLVGDLLFAAAGGRLQVLRAGAQPRLLSSLPLGENVSSAELLVDDDRVLALASGWRADGRRPSKGAPEPATPPGAAASIGPSVPGEPVVRLVLVDVAEPASPRVVETLELDGGYVSARLVDGTVRLVTSSTPRLVGVPPAQPYGPAQERAALERNRQAAARVGVDEVLPRAVRRSGDGTELARGPAVACTAVHHAEAGSAGVSTLLVTTLRPATGLAAVDSTAVTTDGDLVYASADRLYVATSRWGTVAPAGVDGRGDDVTTQVHAFDTSSPDRTPYLASGSVRGYLYGRWALSEHEDALRVATTLQAPWDGGDDSASSVVVLGEQGDRLVERGRLDGLGRGERIYAVRYFGDLATVVTFRQTDPLYVLDLGDAARPRLLGELKVPGFSTYLHPVGDDHLLGVGQDADPSGRVTGMQLSLFDLSDLSTPTQVDRLSLGEAYSPATEDPRAFGYDPAQRLAVLPLLSFDPRTGASASSALGVRVTEDFRLREVGRLDTGRDTGAERVLLGGDLAYAVTPTGVVAARAASLARTGAADFAGVPRVADEVPVPGGLVVPDEVPLPGGGPVSVPPVEPGCVSSSDGAVTCGGAVGGARGGGASPGAAGGG